MERLWTNEALPTTGQYSREAQDAEIMVRDAFMLMERAGYHLTDIECWLVQAATGIATERRISNGSVKRCLRAGMYR